MKLRIVESLEQDALKYQTPEEFVKAKAIMYHGSNSTDPFKKSQNLMGGGFDPLGFNLTADAGYASEFGNVVHQMSSNLQHPLIVNADDLEVGYYRKWMEEKTKGNYDGIIIKPYKDGHSVSDDVYNSDFDFETHIVFDRTQAKTKDQLIDIWKKAHNGIH